MSSLFEITQAQVDSGCWIIYTSVAGANDVFKLSAPVTCKVSKPVTIVRDRTDYFKGEIALATNAQNGTFTAIPGPTVTYNFVFSDGIAYTADIAANVSMSYSMTNLLS